MGQLDEAIRLLEEGLRITRLVDANEAVDAAMLFNTLGAARRQNGELQEAVSCFEQSKRIYIKNEALETPGGALLLVSYSSARRALKDYKTMFELLAHAQHVFEKTGTLETKHGVLLLNTLSTSYRQVGDHAEALRAQCQALAMLRSLEQLKSRKRDELEMLVKIGCALASADAAAGGAYPFT
eukprot:5304913-Amphidinium_carterae.1